MPLGPRRSQSTGSGRQKRRNADGDGREDEQSKGWDLHEELGRRSAGGEGGEPDQSDERSRGEQRESGVTGMHRGESRGECAGDHGSGSAVADRSDCGFIGREALQAVVADRVVEAIAQFGHRGSATAQPPRNSGLDRSEVFLRRFRAPVCAAGHVAPCALGRMSVLTASENRSQTVRWSVNARRPAGVISYVRRRRPDTTDQPERTSPAASSRRSAGYTVPVGRSKCPELPSRRASMTA